jgi:hypothetical protein
VVRRYITGKFQPMLFGGKYEKENEEKIQMRKIKEERGKERGETEVKKVGIYTKGETYSEEDA